MRNNTAIISRADVLMFPCDAAPYECSYSQEYFARNSEHVTLQESYYSNATTHGVLRPYDAQSCRDPHTCGCYACRATLELIRADMRKGQS